MQLGHCFKLILLMSFLASVPISEASEFLEVAHLVSAKKVPKTIVHLKDAEGIIYKRSPRSATLFFIKSINFSVLISSSDFVYPDHHLEQYFAEPIRKIARGPPVA